MIDPCIYILQMQELDIVFAIKWKALWGFSEKIKQVRRELNLSQQQMAEALNVSYTTVNRWEDGRSG